MSTIHVALGLAAGLTLGVVSSANAGRSLDDLKPEQHLKGFTVHNLYENGAGGVMGARFISDREGFVVDLMRIQSVPQAFFWIKTPPTSSMGESHACEHLLLGKGRRGRYVAAQEDMTLSSSTAFTAQTRTCYHFNTIAGEETFYEILEAKLQALLHPDFTDEEIRREVCHLGVTADPKDGTLTLEEKGTVYTEMVSAFEGPWYHWGHVANDLVYGPHHPLSHVSGGDPDVMRKMVPADMWRFHDETHHLGNMGMIVSLPDEIDLEGFLKRMDRILKNCNDQTDRSFLTGIGAFDFPPARPAPAGAIRISSYPSDNPQDPGDLMLAWPADLELEPWERTVLDLFLQAFAGGQTSNLYDLFIDSQTRRIDLGCSRVFGWIDNPFGNSIRMGLRGMDSRHFKEETIRQVREMVLDEIRRVQGFAPGSPELEEFNQRIRNRLVEQRRDTDNYLNSPPMFGFRRGPAGGWAYLLESLEPEAGFRKSLVLQDRFARIESLLALPRNIWTERIDRWGLLREAPHAVGVRPDPEMNRSLAVAKEERLTHHLARLRREYGVTDDQEALARFQEAFDAQTAELEAIASQDELPEFIDHPPMTLDEQLDYDTRTLPGEVPIVVSTFDNMSASTVGLALRLDVVPESLLLYLPFLPQVLTEIGTYRNGDPIPYDVMQERLRQEVLGLHARFDHGYQTGRAELVLTGQGNNLAELQNALGWMEAALFTPYLSTENLPRLIDLTDQALVNYRNRMKGSEESWVRLPATAYRFQTNPLFMSTLCFLTEAHHIQRLRWQLAEPGGPDARRRLQSFLRALAARGEGADRAVLGEICAALSGEETAPQAVGGLGLAWAELTDAERSLIGDIGQAFHTTLADIPDANLAGDWAYLCRETEADLMMPPADALRNLETVLDLLRRSDNARLFMISNRRDREAAWDAIAALVSRLDSEQASERQQYADLPRITTRLRQRAPLIDHPTYVGLVHEGTRNGVLIFSTPMAGVYDAREESVLDCLSGQLYGGGGPHGLFMKTWAAGLAYSNGYGYSASVGRASYYAERCPDVAETMRFVVDQLKQAADDPDLVDYAIAQLFSRSRAPSRYERRGEAMAADLVDGYLPEKVRSFREKVLSLRKQKDLCAKLKERMAGAYGPVLIGYGPPLARSEGGVFFMIGPEMQFESLENYIATAEGPQTVHRLYPRDFWLPM